MNRIIFPYRVKDGACVCMNKYLRYGGQVDYRMDGQVCRITYTSLTIKDNIKPAFQKKLENDRLWQIRVLGIEDRDFVVLHSQLESLGNDVILTDENGNILDL